MGVVIVRARPMQTQFYLPYSTLPEDALLPCLTHHGTTAAPTTYNCLTGLTLPWLSDAMRFRSCICIPSIGIGPNP